MAKQGNIKKERKTFETEVEIPSGVKFCYDGEIATVEGPKGTISKKLKYPRVYVKASEGKALIGSERYTQSEKKIIFTYRAHIKNLVEGVTNGFIYKLVVVYAKFPISVVFSGKTFTVKNFLGEKVPRTCHVIDGVNIKIADKNITVSGIDKEKTGQVAASIEQSCRITHLDRRVIQDGIFITEKPHVRYS